MTSSPTIWTSSALSGDLQVPVGERVNERGELEADMRLVDDLLDEAEARMLAAKEIEACAIPQTEAA